MLDERNRFLSTTHVRCCTSFASCTLAAQCLPLGFSLRDYSFRSHMDLPVRTVALMQVGGEPKAVDVLGDQDDSVGAPLLLEARGDDPR